MSVTQPKGPNPLITDVNSPMYTELSKAGAKWVTLGLAGDAQVFSGRGYDQYIIDSNFQGNIDVAVGDFALLGNRTGVVTAVTKNVGETKIISITVREDMRYLPADYQSNPELYGYTETGFDREITYVVDPTATTPGVQTQRGYLFTGLLLILKQRTNDPATWGTLANSSIIAANQNVLNRIGPFNPDADNLAPDTGDDTIAFSPYSNKADATDLVNGDVLYTSNTGVIVIADGIYYCSDTEVYINIENGVVADLPV